MNINLLIKTAMKARENSYSPYSGFAVGAALLCKSGSIYSGCNIENAAFSPSICAERSAFSKAVSEGERVFSAIAITGGKAEATELVFCSPCGVCLQVMAEFCLPDDFKIILAKSADTSKIYTLSQMLPLSFKKDNLY